MLPAYILLDEGFSVTQVSVLGTVDTTHLTRDTLGILDVSKLVFFN